MSDEDVNDPDMIPLIEIEAGPAFDLFREVFEGEDVPFFAQPRSPKTTHVRDAMRLDHYRIFVPQLEFERACALLQELVNSQLLEDDTEFESDSDSEDDSSV